MKKPSRLIGGRRRWLVASLLLAGVASAGEVAVTVKQTSIRADHQFAAATMATARFTERLEVLGDEAGWFKVRKGNVTGWVHGSAVGTGGGGSGVADTVGGIGSALGSLTGRSSGNEGRGGYSEDEVALAGKGFNLDVEGQYRKRHPGADFKSVDQLEKLEADPKEVGRFAADGKLLAAASAPAPAAATAPKGETGRSDGIGSLLEKAGSLFGGGGNASGKEEKKSGGFDPWAQ